MLTRILTIMIALTFVTAFYSFAQDEVVVEEEVAVEAVVEDGEVVAEEVLPPASPYDLPGSWYVVHSYSGYENKVKANLGTRIKSMHIDDSIFAWSGLYQQFSMPKSTPPLMSEPRLSPTIRTASFFGRDIRLWAISNILMSGFAIPTSSEMIMSEKYLSMVERFNLDLCTSLMPLVINTMPILPDNF